MPGKAKFSITKLRCNNSRIPTITGRYRYPGKLVDCVHCVMIIELVMNTMFYLNVKMLLFVKWEKIISAYSTQRPRIYWSHPVQRSDLNAESRFIFKKMYCHNFTSHVKTVS